MFKRAQVVMLPTEKAVFPKCIWLGRISGVLYLDYSYPEGKICDPIDDSMLPQHLYILSDEEIKGECFYYSPRFGGILRNHLSQLDEPGLKKVIATTDTSLGLPKPSEGFIKAFIEAYNSGNPITEVDIEYYSWSDCPEYARVHTMTESNWGAQYVGKPKVNPKDNTVTIKKVKNSWNREEVINLIDDLWDTVHGRIDFNISQEVLDNWIKQNL